MVSFRTLPHLMGQRAWYPLQAATRQGHFGCWFPSVQCHTYTLTHLAVASRSPLPHCHTVGWAVVCFIRLPHRAWAVVSYCITPHCRGVVGSSIFHCRSTIRGPLAVVPCSMLPHLKDAVGNGILQCTTSLLGGIGQIIRQQYP